MNRSQFAQVVKIVEAKRKQTKVETTRERVARIVAASQPKDAA